MRALAGLPALNMLLQFAGAHSVGAFKTDNVCRFDRRYKVIQIPIVCNYHVVYHAQGSYQLSAGLGRKDAGEVVCEPLPALCDRAARSFERCDMAGAQNVEIAGDKYHRLGIDEDCGRRLGFCSVSIVPEVRGRCGTPAARYSVIQRWSMGHSRSRQGLHSACSRTTRASGPVGPVVVSSVAPKTATVGTPSADATCIAPESLVRNRRQAAARSMNSRSEVARPDCARRGFRRYGLAKLPLRGRAEDQHAVIRSDRAASTNRSGSHRLALP